MSIGREDSDEPWDENTLNLSEDQQETLISKWEEGGEGRD